MSTIKSAPHYFSFLTQTESPFFNESWDKAFAELNSDLTWIDELEKEMEETYSRDFDDTDFPSYHIWPKNWRDAFESASRNSRENIKKHLLNAEKHEFDGITLYILEDQEEVWLSTPHYDYGSITKMESVDKYDSAITAAYIYLNEYENWSKKHKRSWDIANALSETGDMSRLSEMLDAESVSS